MIGLGTIVNTLAIIAGSSIGIIAKKGLSERFQDQIMKTLGLATMFIGIGCTLSEMLSVNEDGSLSTNGIMMMIISLVIGSIVGELLRIENRLEGLGDKMKRSKLFAGETKFTEGFVTATLVVCVGAMAIVGSLRDGLEGDPSLLFSKSILDFISTMIFASTLGIGVLCSAIPLALYQGLITAPSGVIGEYLTEQIISDMSLVGSVMIFAVGINLFFGKKVKVGNMLPALIVPIIYGIFLMLTAK
ncbi:MAG: DUF554 domain-containing protein [Ruminococcaceae bacterium]|nr:DUF554 domain-containing protein [Oscillospiraceae bacterium]